MEKYNYLIEWSGDNYEKKGGAPFFFIVRNIICELLWKYEFMKFKFYPLVS